MENKLISIIVPVYNVENYLNKCIDSILAQTYTNLEIILVDDGSPDNCPKICDEYAKKDSRIKVVHKENGGLSDARNIALDIAKGDYIGFVDSDDFIEKDMYETLYNIINKENADIATCSHYIYSNEKVINNNYSKKKNVYNTEEAVKKLILDKDIRFYVWDKLYKRKLWENIRFPVGRKFEDIATTPKVFINAKKIVFYDCPLYYYLKRQDSLMGKRTKEQQLDYIKSILEINSYLINKIEEIDYYLNYNLVHATLNVFRSIGTYNIENLQNEKNVEELYKKAIEIMNIAKYSEFINKHCNNAKKVHLYYLLTDKLEYIKNIKYLPDIYRVV